MGVEGAGVEGVVGVEGAVGGAGDAVPEVAADTEAAVVVREESVVVAETALKAGVLVETVEPDETCPC